MLPACPVTTEAGPIVIMYCTGTVYLAVALATHARLPKLAGRF